MSLACHITRKPTPESERLRLRAMSAADTDAPRVNFCGKAGG